MGVVITASTVAGAAGATAPVSVTARTIQARPNGRLQLRLACRLATTSCRGRLTLAWRMRGHRQTIGTAQFAISGRTVGVVTIVLTPIQRRALARARSARATTTIAVRVSSSRFKRLSVALRIRAPRA